MKKTISQNMIEILTLNGQKSVWYGDIKVIEECANKSNVQKGHPQKTIQCVLNALEYSKYFEKSYIISDHTGKKRHSIKFCVKANPVRQKVACKASGVWYFLLIAMLPQAETVCAPKA